MNAIKTISSGSSEILGPAVTARERSSRYADMVKLHSRQYSLDERRTVTFF